ncbi:MAG TPA: hopanoid biosynthesis-associated protein HpnK [Candidatus Acidoferrales bacterium]|nr:hopanoid biosynthesis-associated protein HpnK [Candidatus Acidoferrales bacterium]
MRRLIVNGDDFGYTRGVNAGIVRAYRHGILTSTTLMATGEAFEDAVRLALENPGMGVGAHLVLVGGKAVTPPEKIPSLADPTGRLPGTPAALVARLALGRMKQADLEAEIAAQIGRIRAAGIRPTHVDTHKHTHFYPGVMKAVARMASEFGIDAVRKPYENLRTLLGRGGAKSGRARGQFPRSLAAATAGIGHGRFRRLAAARGLRTPDYFCGIRWTGSLSPAALLRILERLPEGTTEMMCHPGLHDDDLERARTRLKRERQQELEALTAPEVVRAASERGILLISYRELAAIHE